MFVLQIVFFIRDYPSHGKRPVVEEYLHSNESLSHQKSSLVDFKQMKSVTYFFSSPLRDEYNTYTSNTHFHSFILILITLH